MDLEKDGVADPAGRRDRRRTSSGVVDERRRAVVVDNVVGEESSAGRRSGGRRWSMGFCGFWRPRCTNGGAKGKGGGAKLRDTLVLNVGYVTSIPPSVLTSRRGASFPAEG